MAAGRVARESFIDEVKREGASMDASLAKKKSKKRASNPSSAARSRLLATPCNWPVKAPGEDDVCFICHDAGTLVKCDRRHCEKAYHPECVRRNVASFTASKKAWICARHFCSKCSKQPCTYCVMCPSSFCSKCMPMVVYWPLSEEAGFCENCIPLIQLVELQHTTENLKSSNVEVSETRRYLFKEYWLLLKRFYAYTVTKCSLSNAFLHLLDKPKIGVPSTAQTTAIALKNFDAPTGPILVKEVMTASSQNVQVSVKRLRSPMIRPARKKVRVLRLLHDSSSEDEERNKVSNGDLCVTNLQTSSDVPACEKPQNIKVLPTSISVYSALPSSSTTRAPLFDSNQTLPVVVNTSPSLHRVTSLPLLAKPRGMVNPAPLPVDKTSCKKTTIMTATKNFLLQNSEVSLLDQVSSVTSGLGAVGTHAHPCNSKLLPAVVNSSFPSLPNPTHNFSIVSCNASEQPIVNVETDPHGDIATDSSSNKPTILAPINVQNVSLIFLRRSQIEELLSDQRFTLLILGAFVRIRNTKHGNNYRLVQIAGTNRQAQYYQVGKRSTNVVLEVRNLNRQQQIKIDHVSDHMFTQEECKRLQQSIELGFIDAPTMGALEQMAAALQKGKANKGVQAKETAHSNNSKHGQELASIAGKEEDELSEKKNRGSLEIRTGETASVCKTHSECGYPGMEEFSVCKDLGNLTADTQNKGWDGWWVFNQAQLLTGKQLDGDQQSDISVELGTENLGKEQCNVFTDEGLTSNGKLCYPEDEAEAIFPLKVLKKAHNDFAPGSREEGACHLAETMNEAHDVMIDRELVGIYTAHMQSNLETLFPKDPQERKPCGFAAEKMNNDIGSIPEVMNQAQVSQSMQDNTKTQLSGARSVKQLVATNAHVLSSNPLEVTQKVEGRRSGDKISSGSAMCESETLNISEETSQSDFQDYATRRYQMQTHCIDFTCQIGNHVVSKGHVKEHTLPVALSMNDEQAIEWFYQDRKEITHGPFSLKQLRKWAKTDVFPSDLIIWRTVSGEKFCILLKSALDALDAKETALPSCMETGKCPVTTEDCLNHGSKVFCDAGASYTKEDLQVISTTHLTHSGHGSISIVGDRVTSRIYNGKLYSEARRNLCESTLLKSNDMSGNQEQNQGISVCRDSVTTKECEKLSRLPEQINKKCSREPYILAKEKDLGGEGDCNFVLAQTECRSGEVHTAAMAILPKDKGNCSLGPVYADTSAKLTLPGGEKDEKSTSASTKEIATEGGLQGPSSACIEENTTLGSTQRTLSSITDGGQDPLTLVTNTLGSPSAIPQALQVNDIEEGDMLHECEKVTNKGLLVSKEEREKERGESTIVKDELLVSKGEPNSEHREQKQETFVNLQDDGWALPGVIDSETLWTTQLDALKAEIATLDRIRDEIWSNFIGEATMVENQWQFNELPENESADWEKKACDLERRQDKNTAPSKEDCEGGTWNSVKWSSICQEERPGDFLHGWTTHNKDDIVQGTRSERDSAWSTAVQLQGPALQGAPDLLSSMKPQPRSKKQDEKKVKDLWEGGSETDVNVKGVGMRVFHGIDGGTDQCQKHTIRGHSVEPTLDGSSRGDHCILNNSGCVDHLKTFEIGNSSECGGHSRKAGLCQEQGESRRQHQSRQKSVDKDSSRSFSQIEGKSWRKQTMSPRMSVKREEARRIRARNESKSSAGKHKSSSENHRRYKSRGQKGGDEGVSRSNNDDHRHSRPPENSASPKRTKEKTEEVGVSHPRSGVRYLLHGERCPKRSRRNREELRILRSRCSERSHSREREFSGSRSSSWRWKMEESTCSREEEGRKSCATISTSRDCEPSRTRAKKVDKVVRENCSQNDYRSHLRHGSSSPASAGKKLKDGRRFSVRNDRKYGSGEEEAQEVRGRRMDGSKGSHERRSHQRHIPRSGSHKSPSHIYQKKQESSSKLGDLRAQRKDPDDSVYWRRHNVNNSDGARRHLVCEGLSPGKRESLSGIHVVSPSQPPPYDDRGWTPPSSPLKNGGGTPPSSLLKTPANCDSSVTAIIKRPSHPFIQSSASTPGAVVQEGSIGLPRPSPMKLPSPPPLPAETSHLRHIND